jgi:hypothetical protein
MSNDPAFDFILVGGLTEAPKLFDVLWGGLSWTHLANEALIVLEGVGKGGAVWGARAFGQGHIWLDGCVFPPVHIC